MTNKSHPLLNSTKLKHAFTILELSIVLIVIALIIGSIMVGQSLIRSSELQAVTTELGKYSQAVSNFTDKYQALPGDFSGATAIWGAAHATHATCITTTTGKLTTCDGDGDGRIVDHTTDAAPNITSTYYEQFRAWQHLANAQMIDGNYSGIATSANFTYTISTDIPTSKLTAAGWKIMTVSTRDLTIPNISEIVFDTGTYSGGEVLWFGGAYFEDTQRMTPVLSSREAYDIDIKLDDGLGGTGKVLAQTNSAAGTCTTASAYQADDQDVAAVCSLIFKANQ